MITTCNGIFSQRMGLSYMPVLCFLVLLLQGNNIFVEQQSSYVVLLCCLRVKKTFQRAAAQLDCFSLLKYLIS